MKTRALAACAHGLPTSFSTEAVDCSDDICEIRRAKRHVTWAKLCGQHSEPASSSAIIAALIASLRETAGLLLFSIIQAAGWPIWPLLICSIVALALVIERFINLRAPRVSPPKLLDEVLSVTRQSLPGPDVVTKLAANSELGSVLAAGLRAVMGDPRIQEGALRQAFEIAGRSAFHRLERYLNALGTIAAAAPLLGLLGTVIGMIEIFGSQAPTGGNNPAMLAHGISIALYNTAFGLIIAIPSLMFYRYFRRLIDEYALSMEMAAERMVPHLMRFAVRAA
jgi:biopolymer transport protein ExbB